MTSDNTRNPFKAPEPTRLEEGALLWFTRRDAGLTPAQEKEFRAWLEADPRNRAALEAYDRTWALFDGLPDAPATGDARKPQPVMQSCAHGRLHRRFAFRVLGGAIAAAAAVCVAYFSWWRPIHFTQAIATEVGEWRNRALPDGSVVDVNTDSVVFIQFTPEERRVVFKKGEAHFTVAKNATRPFLVEVGDVVVRAVGTSFKIRLLPGTVDVLVTEGRVRLDEARKTAPLAIGKSEVVSPQSAISPQDFLIVEGQRAMVQLAKETPEPARATARVIDVPVAQIRRELSWQTRRLEFFDASLTEITAEFNRYNERPLVVADAALAEQRFGGAFQANDPDNFVRMLRENYPVRVEERDGSTYLYSSR